MTDVPAPVIIREDDPLQPYSPLLLNQLARIPEGEPACKLRRQAVIMRLAYNCCDNCFASVMSLKFCPEFTRSVKIRRASSLAPVFANATAR